MNKINLVISMEFVKYCSLQVLAHPVYWLMVSLIYLEGWWR